MFYNGQPKSQQEEYKGMLAIIGSLTRLFAEDKVPYLPYRCQENIFCKYFEAENLARRDCSADAKKGSIGIGLKTWRGRDDQKVAEFGKLKQSYANKSGLDLILTISEYRNKRIEITKNLYDIETMVYHIVKRVPNAMKILECAFDEIEIENICLIENRGNDNNTYFTDGKHTYHFSTSKNTLYMIFDDMEELDTLDVEIIEDPYKYLTDKLVLNDELTETSEQKDEIIAPNSICLRLYTVHDGEKVVSEKSGLNQWNAKPRLNTKTGKMTPRNPNELYIPYPVMDRKRIPDFFPPRDTSFDLKLPDGQVILAKVCQDNSKAIMSNPNSLLGEWLLRKVFNLPVGTLLTYDMLKIFDIDSVIFTKLNETTYSIDFAPIGTYEKYYDDEYNDIVDAE